MKAKNSLIVSRFLLLALEGNVSRRITS